MYRVLIVMTLEYEARQIRQFGVWGEKSGFLLEKTAYDGQEALNLLRAEQFDLVLTEVKLPLLDGLQLQRHIYEENLCPVVVVLSQSMEYQCVRECIMYGAFDYLQKMPDEETLLEMLTRAREHLIRNGRDGMGERAEFLIDMEGFREDENAVVEGILQRNGRAPQIFRAAVSMLYRMNQAYSVKADIQARQFFRNIVNRVFEQMSWLHLYTKVEDYYRPDALFIDREVHSEMFYGDKLEQLADFVQELYPHTKDHNVQKISWYVLEHPEADLQLKRLAADMFVNYSYLSSSFSALAGVTYSEYVTKVRMMRAAFLLLHTGLRVGEIGARLTYRNTDYFTQQFKRQFLLTPKAFREANEPSADYSLL